MVASTMKTKRFFLLFLPVAIIVIFGILLVSHSEAEREFTKIRLSEKSSLHVGANSIKRVVQSITHDLAYLANQETLIDAAYKKDTTSTKRLQKDWLIFSFTKGIYDQIRWLDTIGKEQVRINHNGGKPSVVSVEKLQNKGERYYFNDTLKLNKGEFFISPLDLNIEQGKIEQPIKPMIRIGTPFFNNEGKKQGIVLVNYYGESMLQEFSQVLGEANTRAWLINRDGYWIKGPSAELEWGFMYQQKEASLPHLYPDSWEKILATNQGQFVDKHGLWTFATIYPLLKDQKPSTDTHEHFVPSHSNLDEQNYYWKVVLLLPTVDYLSNAFHTALQHIIVAGILLTIVAIVLWRLTTAWIRVEETEEQLRQINFGLEATVEERTKELQIEIAERKNIENEIRDREERFRSITNTSSVAMIVTVDEFGSVVTWNPTAEEVFGYSESEVLGCSLIDFMPERYRASHQKGLKRALETEVFHLIGKTVEVYGLKKSGEEFPIELSLGTWRQKGTRYFSAVILDISERKLTEEKLKHLATHDNLTGLPTRVLCVDHIAKAIAYANRYNCKAAVLFIDLDGFKAINDTMGHDAGDNLLISVGSRIKGCIREMDTVARIGGDEFVIVMENIENKADVEKIAQNIIQTLAFPFNLADNVASISASIGIALYPDNAQDYDQLIKSADDAMYSVKAKGKNNYAFTEVS